MAVGNAELGLVIADPELDVRLMLLIGTLECRFARRSDVPVASFGNVVGEQVYLGEAPKGDLLPHDRPPFGHGGGSLHPDH
ncbi:MAG: hypothetical protein ACRDZ2_07590 [Ilumatobacteraceae bacterium]